MEEGDQLGGQEDQNRLEDHHLDVEGGHQSGDWEGAHREEGEERRPE